MSYKSKVDFIRDTLKDLETSSQFFHMRDFDFEQVQQEEEFVVVLSPMVKQMLGNAGTSSYTDQTTLRLRFLKKTETDDSQAEIEEAINECGKMADEFVRLFHNNHKNPDRLDTSQGINFISAVTNDPIINELAEVLTGINLVHDVVFRDDFDYCSEC